MHFALLTIHLFWVTIDFWWLQLTLLKAHDSLHVKWIVKIFCRKYFQFTFSLQFTFSCKTLAHDPTLGLWCKQWGFHFKIALFFSNLTLIYTSKWEISFPISKIGKPHHAVQKDTAHQELRVLLASIHHWSPKWVFAEPLHLLCQSEEIVR